MKKRLLFLILLISFLFPIKSLALSGNVTFSCNSTTVNVNDEIRCKIVGYSDLQVSEVFANLSADGNIRIKNFKAERIWDIRSEWPNLSLYSTTKNPGNFEIGTVYLTAKTAGTGTFYMTGITFNGEDGSTISVASKSVSVTIKGTTPVPTPDPTPEPTPEPPVVKSSDSKLKSLTVSIGKIDFNPSVTEYNIEVGSNINTIRFEAVPNDTKATVKLPDSLSLKEGANQFLIVVTAEDSSTTTYTINVNKLEKILSDNALLSSLKINGYDIKFSKDVFEYNLGTIKSNKLDINAISDDEKSTVVVLGNDNIGKDDTVIIEVTSEAGTVRRYIVYASYEKAITQEPVVDNSMLTIVSALFAFASFIVFILVVTRKKIVRKKEKDPVIDEAKRAKELEKKQKQEAIKKEKEMLKQQKLQAKKEARLKKEAEKKLAEAKRQEEIRQRKLQEEQRRLEEIARKEALAKEKNDQAALAKAAKEKEKQLREIKLREDKEKAEREKAEREAAKKESEKRLKEEKERSAREREERERHKREMEEKSRETKKLQDEREKLEKERARLERLQQEQEKRDNSEKTKEEKERLKKEQAERAKATRELEEQYRQEREKEKKLKAERDKAMKEKMAKERIEQEKAAKEQAKQDKIDAAKQKELEKLQAKEAKPVVEEEDDYEEEEEVDNEALIKERYKDSENISSEKVEKVVNSAPAPETVVDTPDEEEEDDFDVMEISPEEVLSVVKKKKKKKMSNAINAKNNN